ncbi:hypothetical protein H5410_040913 [Solanum commersonii]|uniref:Uncharacterized protein n=1 Tax=Solanum commersonii TaxID=4109 RepID=A0A9J5XS70_SOLCO|nr:hypothetical protein H5410_040913 [Solanum commersonii]
MFPKAKQLARSCVIFRRWRFLSKYVEKFLKDIDLLIYFTTKPTNNEEFTLDIFFRDTYEFTQFE